MSFSSDIKRFRQHVIDNTETVQKKIAFDVARKLIKRTPVDTGRARANWHVELNNQRKYTTEATDKTGSAAIAQAQGALRNLSINDAAYITNNLPYFERLEDGSSTQAPLGMVKVTVAEYKSIVERAARAVLRKSAGDIL